ncbi:hypothetical protein VB715_14755 [Crocosphaera sp. UHCC 0190]|uniref:LIC_10190 family membrane protein n=1 Tax=Crocosphaera sp. UHCC 0190 TaxID=3110246 RepID=UPI002B1E9DE7|nr:hypothetical protein [Crocosphaera sp. UHCC 0190]MEA5511031.1 hypothetical protein [Crocosphaera sp. UHCC 0190]
MIYFLLIWVFLGFSSYLLGILILQICFSQGLKRIGDRVIIAVWLGVIFLANLFLATALIMPLSFPTGMIIILSCSFLCLLSPTVRQEIITLKSRLSLNFLLPILTLTWGVALLTTTQVTWSESGAYHYSAMRWLSEFGVVPGLVLILKNLGITSSWFAFIAPFNGSIVAFRAGAVANSFLFLVMLGHLYLSFWRGIRRKAHLCDGFAISFNSLLLLYLASSQEMQSILVSLSPDWPIALSIGMTAWAILLTRDSSVIVIKPSILKQQLSFLPLLLGVGAVTIKLSALPLLFITGIFYGWYERKSMGRLIEGILVVVILLLPMILVGLWTSGCPLYPSSLLCLDVPWSQSLEETQNFAAETSNLENWFGQPSAGENPVLWLITQWITARLLNLVMMILAVLSLGCLICLSKMLWKPSLKGGIWVSGLGVLGIMFIFLQGPLIRFGLGYLLILPALLLAIFLKRQFILKNDKLIKLSKSKKKWKFLGILGIFLGSMMIIGLNKPNFLLPSPFPNQALIKKQVNDVIYFKPLDGGCWASVLPCRRSRSPIKLRKPALGIKGGFVNTQQTSP